MKKRRKKLQREYTPIIYTPPREQGFFTPDSASFRPFVNYIEVEKPQPEARMIKVRKKKPVKAEVLQGGTVSPIRKKPSKSKRESTEENPKRSSKIKQDESEMQIEFT